MSIQMDFFRDSETEELRAEVVKMKEQVNNLRRGMFGRYDKMCNELNDIQESIMELKGIKDGDSGKILEISL